MFGVLRGTSCSLKRDDRQAWMGHICGTCIALRDNYGQPSRLTTNYDAALLSVLCEAQNPAPAEQITTFCPLRSKATMPIAAPDSGGAKYAASVALLMASTKIEDHVEDKETFLRHIPYLATKLARNWKKAATQTAQTLDFNTALIEEQTSRQSAVEAQPNRDFFYYSRPTEVAVGAAFRHTAVIAHCPQNADILYEMGQMFGRIMYLLDSYQDYAADVAANKFNALAASFREQDIKQHTERIFQQAYQNFRKQFHQLELAKPDLARKLLIQQLKQKGHRVLDLTTCGGCSCRLPSENATEAKGEVTTSATARTNTTIGMNEQQGLFSGLMNLFSKYKRKRENQAAACCGTLVCCDMCSECCCCCDFDICGCDDGGCEICECECCEFCECSVCQCCGRDAGCCDCDCDCCGN